VLTKKKKNQGKKKNKVYFLVTIFTTYHRLVSINVKASHKSRYSALPCNKIKRTRIPAQISPRLDKTKQKYAHYGGKNKYIDLGQLTSHKKCFNVEKFRN